MRRSEYGFARPLFDSRDRKWINLRMNRPWRPLETLGGGIFVDPHCAGPIRLGLDLAARDNRARTMPTLSKIRDSALVLFLVFAAVVNGVTFKDYVFDDSFITYKYARNIAEGHGFVFNLGERVLGTTTPLFTLLLAGLSLLGFNIVHAAVAIYSVSVSACGYIGARILRSHGVPNAGALFAVLISWGMGGVFVYMGMETTFYVALIFGAIWAVPTERRASLGVLLGLIACTRYDGVIAVGLVLLYRWLLTKKPPLREALIAGGLLGSWLLFAQLYFGSPLPNTLGAKIADSSFLHYWKGSLEYQLDQVISPLRRFGLRNIHLAFPILLTALLLFPVFLRANRLHFHLWLFPAIGAALWIGYSLIGPPTNQGWHLMLSVYCLAAFGFASWGKLIPTAPHSATASWCTIGLLVLSSVTLPILAERECRSMVHSPQYGDRILAYERLAEWILRHGLEDEPVMTLEPGYMSFLTDQPVIDAAGLVTKGIRYHGPMQKRDTFESLIDSYEPELVVMRVLGAPKDWLEDDYTLVYRVGVAGLFMRNNVVARHLNTLHKEWVQDSPLEEDKRLSLNHPFQQNFRSNNRPANWRTPGFSKSPFGRALPDVRAKAKVFRDGYLRTVQPMSSNGGAVISPHFLINFDELRFSFGGTDPMVTQAQLLIEGVKVLEFGGQEATLAPEVQSYSFPVRSWRGKYGTLQFVDLDNKPNYLVADDVHSRSYTGYESLDDFETGEYGDHWERSFGDSPTPSIQIAREIGLPFALGKFSATSLGLKNARQMSSKPFLIEHNVMSFLAFDFAGGSCRIELRVDGKRIRNFACRNSRTLKPVSWSVAKYKGKQATLVLIDGAKQVDRWVGIDSIHFFDGLEGKGQP
ncbi:MAG: hypothetical protein ACI9F9_001349 [Candidatus Paceibacteria bacterium]|jgi:hypothetical protein